VNVPTLDIVQLNNHGNPWPFNDPATEKEDCNVAKTSEAVHYFNGAQLTAKQTRTAGHALSGPTGTTLTNDVFQSQGMVKGTDYILARGVPIADLRHLYLRTGWYVGAFVNYGVLNHLGALTGDKNYNGIHCIGLWGWRRSVDGILVWDHDPLFDGRRPAIPFGRQHVPFDPIQHALEAYAGPGLWSGWAVKIPL
jgi:hypothetical protein